MLFGGEEEVGWAAVGDGAGGRASGKYLTAGIGRGNRHDQTQDGSNPVVEGAEADAVIGDPPGRAGLPGESPGIYQVGVGDWRYPWFVGDEVDLGVVLGKGSGRRCQSERCDGCEA